MRRFFLLIILLIFVHKFSFSQKTNSESLKKNNNSFLLFSYQKGYVFQSNVFVRGLNAKNEAIKNYQSISLKFIKQTKGNKLWEQLFAYPEYGIGLFFGDFYNPVEIGYPIAIYGYFSAPFYRKRKFTFNYEVGLGLTSHWKSYSETNIYNMSIGSIITTFIDLGLKAEYQFTNNFYLDIGFSFTHFSNGGIKEPNYGLNTISPKLAIKYKLNNEPIVFKEQIVPKFKPKNELYISASVGYKFVRNLDLGLPIVDKYDGKLFPAYGFTSNFSRQISHKSKFGIGFGFYYDGSINDLMLIKNSNQQFFSNEFNNFQLGLYPSYELVLNKVSVILQLGFYLFRKPFEYPTPKSFQLVGLKYNLYKNFFLGINMRAYSYSVCDFIEWNVGYRIF